MNYREAPDEEKSYRLFNARMDETGLTVPIIRDSREHKRTGMLIEDWLADPNLAPAGSEKETVNFNCIYDLLTELDKGNF